MPVYVDDPETPGNKIDVIKLLKRDPTTAPPPDGILLLMRRDRWTRNEALLILAGYDPRNIVDSAGHPIGTQGAGMVYLDGTTSRTLSIAGLHHPLETEFLMNYMNLREFSQGEPMDERRTPQEWLAWAKSKNFSPYWLEYMSELAWNNECEIDWEYWLEKMPSLTRAQASRLMSGLAPETYKDLEKSPNKNDHGEQRLRAKKIETLAEAEGKENDGSLEWLLWGESKGLTISGAFTLNVRKFKYREQEKKKQAEGRYTLKEAAEILEKEGEARDGQMLAKLMKAVESGELKAYWPGCKDRYSGKQTQDNYEEVYWDELNEWLNEHEPRISFRFTKPENAASPGTPMQATKHEAHGKQWQEQARKIADEFFDSDTANNCRNSLAGYSERVMMEMQKKNIHGPRGRIVNPRTIQREALQAKKWWANKVK
ncbi:MAG: hypothetical protein KGI54_12660 [Pseudomonadota bacterium]|nr:hypothetical protein [Pseudomonadota bacterium]